jgi:hypothetical protein
MCSERLVLTGIAVATHAGLAGLVTNSGMAFKASRQTLPRQRTTQLVVYFTGTAYALTHGLG